MFNFTVIFLQVLRNCCLLAILSGALARPQYITDLIRRAPAPSAHQEPQPTQTANDYPPEDVQEVAARKRNYQAAFAALASQMASQSRIFTGVTSNMPPRQPLALQTNNNLYHRNVIPIARSRETRLIPAYTYRQPALFSPARPIPYPRLPTSQNRVFYIYNRVENLQPSEEPVRRLQEPVVILPNGFLADTPEVEAAKREHLAAVERARAASVRTELRRQPYVISYRPPLRRHSQPHSSTPQIYYEL